MSSRRAPRSVGRGVFLAALVALPGLPAAAWPALDRVAEPVQALPEEGPADPERALYDYARSLSEREREFAGLAGEELERYDRLYPEGRYLDDVHYRLGRVAAARGREHEQALRLLQVVVVDAGSLREPVARQELDRLLAGERGLKPLRRRYEQAIERYRDPLNSPLERRLAYVRALLLVDNPESRERVVAEGVRHLERDPGSEAVPELVLALGDLERRRGEAHRALAAYERLRFLRPQDPLVARALFATGQVLEQDLKQPVAAVATYERVAREWEASSEAASAWYRMGLVERGSLKRPEIAVRDFDEVLGRYPDHPDAFDARMAKAETLAADFNDPARAEAVLLEGLDREPDHARAPELLERAGVLAEEGRKDRRRAARHFQDLAERYPSYPGAPAALLRAAELLEREGDAAAARELYRDTERRFPGTKAAERAARRAAKLEPAPR